MQRTKSKILSILLSLVMLLSLVPAMGVTALAAGNHPTYVQVCNASGDITSLGDGECLATNDGTATSYNGGAYVARYDKSSGTLYLKGYRGIAKERGIAALGDLNIKVESDSSFTTSSTSNETLMGIQASGKLSIVGPGKLTLRATAPSDAYGIFAKEGIEISAPLNLTVEKNNATENGLVYGIYAKSGAISLSGSDMTVTATGGAEFACGVYNDAKISSTAADNGNIDISGKLTVNLSNGKNNRGISSEGGVITLNGATVKIPGSYYCGIYNARGNVVNKNRSDVDISTDISSNRGIWTEYDGSLTIEDSTVKVSSAGLAAEVYKNASIKDSKVDLTRTSNHYEVIRTDSTAANTIDLSGSGSVTLTATGKQDYSMFGGTVTLRANTKCETGNAISGWNNYAGKYDEANNITVLKFVHESTTPTTNISVSGTIKSYGSASDAVTVTLTPTAGGTPLTTPPTGASGSAPYSQNYSFSAVPAGTYTLKVEKKGHAPWTEEITVGTDDITGKDVTIYLIGDVNKDGAISVSDMQRLYAHLNGTKLLTDTSTADVNNDKLISVSDMQRLYAHLNGTKPLSW